MIIPSMTLIEVRKEYEKDWPIVSRKGDYLLKELRHKARPHGKDIVVRFHDYLSKNQNNWIIRLELSKKESFITKMAYFNNNSGLSAILSIHEDRVLIFHTPNFFKRFNERLHLGLSSPMDIFHAFLNESNEYEGTRLNKIAPGIYKLFSATPKGYCLGTYDENIKFMKMSTFITHDMLKDSQVDIAVELSSRIEKYSGNASNLL
jgi:hypothetical protein